MAASTETDRLDNPLMPPRIGLKPGLIATVYVALAGLWSVVSNAIGELFPMGDRHLEAIVDIANEFAFIAVSGALLYFVLAWSRRNLLTARESLGRIAEASDADRRRVERVAKIGHWIWRADPGTSGWEGGSTDYSVSGAAIFGVTPAELRIGNREYIDRFVHPDDRERVAKYYAEPRQGDQGFDLLDYRIIRADGEIRNIHEASDRQPGFSVTVRQGTIQDVTEIKQTEENLAESEARFRDFTRIASHFQWELDEDLRIVSHTTDYSESGAPNWREVLGLKPWQSAGIQEASEDPQWAALERLLLRRLPFHELPYSVAGPSGEIFYRRASGQPIFGPGGKFRGYRCVSRDETREVKERRRALAAEDLLMRAIESISEGFCIYDSADRLMMTNRNFRDIFPAQLGDSALGKTFEDLVRAEIALGFYPEAAGREEEFFQQRLAAHRQSGRLLIFKNDKGRWFQARDYALPDGSKACIRTDVTELMEKDRALRESQANLAAAQRIAKLGSWELDLRDLDKVRDNPLRWSDETFRIFGYEPGEIEVSRESFFKAVHPADRAKIDEAMERALTQGVPYNIEHRIMRPDGREAVVREMSDLIRDPETLAPIKMVGTVQDITAIKRTEDALRQAQKMEAIGQLTGGIAHDFNNLMTVVGGNLELLGEGLSSGDPRLQKFARMAHDAVLRGGNLTQRLLAFARRQTLQPAATDLNGLVLNLVPLLHHSLGEQITVETALGADIWNTRCDASQLENALLNLAVNARDAMANGGRLTIRTENLNLEGAWASENSDWPPGDYVMVAVSDTGQGMPSDVRDKVFEPFFTTKDAGKGTGLGLSMVYGFVKQSGGQIKVYSEVGHGTTVKLFLPRAQASAASERPEPETDIPRGSESVLLVEDDEMVRATAAIMLRDLGYRVTEATDGRSALALIESKPPFDLILTDVVMPGGMTGWDMAQAIWMKKPGVKVLFSTGYTDNPIFRNSRRDRRIQVLSKPYSKRGLALKLREAIDRPGGRCREKD